MWQCGAAVVGLRLFEEEMKRRGWMRDLMPETVRSRQSWCLKCQGLESLALPWNRNKSGATLPSARLAHEMYGTWDEVPFLLCTDAAWSSANNSAWHLDENILLYPRLKNGNLETSNGEYRPNVQSLLLDTLHEDAHSLHGIHCWWVSCLIRPAHT